MSWSVAGKQERNEFWTSFLLCYLCSLSQAWKEIYILYRKRFSADITVQLCDISRQMTFYILKASHVDTSENKHPPLENREVNERQN